MAARFVSHAMLDRSQKGMEAVTTSLIQSCMRHCSRINPLHSEFGKKELSNNSFKCGLSVRIRLSFQLIRYVYGKMLVVGSMESESNRKMKTIRQGNSIHAASLQFEHRSM